MTAIAPDPNLLFGLLALQNGLINQVQLVAAFQAWTLDRARALADHFIALGHLNQAQRAVVQAMADLHVAKHGDLERSLAALFAGRSTHESLAQIGDADIHATLARLGSALTDRDRGAGADSDRTASYAVGTATSDGQRFRLLRPHARGGLAAVFVALDQELHREVALKQILEQHADDATSRARFLLEAEITGGLEHPGIVPIYGLGSYDDGRPFYAMRFIKGDSLKEAADRFHADESLRKDPGRRALELRQLLRRFIDVCDAIAYAHSRGVLHRDIKPGNVIVGKYGETLVVDWGLAKATGRPDSGAEPGERTLVPSSASGSAETLPGSALGTPAYMSPEQAEGDLQRLGPRSDVYSLGAALYYLLTGRPPVEGEVGEVLRAVQKGEFPPPRRHDAAIDPALEAVCVKAMAHRPEDRYASPRALAEDLERWMADEPLTAWREPISRRARRWARRNRPLVTAAAAAVLVALAGTAAALAVQTRANADLKSANLDLALANSQVERANADLRSANGRVQARFDLAREAIRSFKAGVEEEEALKEDRLRPLRDKLLGSARRFYDKLGDLLKGEPDAGSKAVLAESYLELGALIDRIGQKPEALEAYRKAVATRRELLERPGAGSAERVALARALYEQGWEAQQVGDLAGALAASEEAVALAEPLAAGAGSTIEARRALGFALHRAGLALWATGADERALAAYRRALAVREPLAGDPAAVPDDRLQLSYTIQNIGEQLGRAGDTAGALAEQRRNQELCRALAEQHPAVPDYRRELANSHNWVGDLLEQTGDTAGALAEHRKAQELIRALATEHPAVADYRLVLVASHNRVGSLLGRAGDTAGALAEQRKARELIRALATEHPAVPVYRRALAVSHNRVGDLLTTVGRPAEALAELEQARTLTEALARAAPSVPLYCDDLVFTLNYAGAALRDLGRAGEARDRHARAVALAEALAAADPKVPRYRASLADSLRRLAGLKRDGGDDAGADADARRAVALFEGLPSRDGREWFWLACARATLAAAAGSGGAARSAADAPGPADRVMDDLRRAVAMGYRSPAVFEHEPALAPLRGRADFRLLMMDLAIPADPFAAAR
jgi:serine/threonine-protein kinase